MKKLLVTALAAAMSFTAIASSTIEDINKSAEEIRQIRHLLESDDKNIQAAAIHELLTSKNITKIELAYNFAFNSSDEYVNVAALRYKFDQLESLTLKIHKPKLELQAGPELANLGDIINLNIYGYDRARGILNLKKLNGSGMLTGRQLTLTFEVAKDGKTTKCTGDSMYKQKGEFEGTLICGSTKVPFTTNVY